MRPFKRRNWRGFTLTEFLVVVAILLVLLLLLLPGLQLLRKMGDRSRCENNLMQLGQAATAFNSTYGYLPPPLGWNPHSKWNPHPPEDGYTVVANGGTAAYGNAFFHLLPYIGEDNLYKNSAAPFSTLWSGDKADEGQANMPWMPWANPPHNKPIKTYICPADPSVDSGGTVVGWGAGCYAYNFQVFGTVNPSIYDTWLGSQPPDVFPPANYLRGGEMVEFWNTPGLIPESTDGTSNTILFGEKYARCLNNDPQTNSQGSLWDYWGFDPWAPVFGAGGSGALQFGSNAIGPQSKFQVQPTPFLGNCDPGRAATGHSAGMNACLADGSVRSISSKISERTWWIAVVPNDCQAMPGDW